jgi:hypothetical protein
MSRWMCARAADGITQAERDGISDQPRLRPFAEGFSAEGADFKMTRTPVQRR